MAPAQFVLAGSSNGNTWFRVDEQSIEWLNTNPQLIVLTPYLSSYTYYRLITTKIKGGNTAVCISKLKYFIEGR
jgi:hypothetical protein